MLSFAGKKALPFELKSHDGETFRLDDFRGRWLLMVFHRHLG